MKKNLLFYLLFLYILCLFSCSDFNHNDLIKTIKLKNLTFDKNPGLYNETIDISINSVNGGTIYYTLDGTNPTKDSYIYNSPITLSKDNSSTTITAIEMKDGFENSELLIGTFIIKYEDITSIDFYFLNVDSANLYTDNILYIGNDYNIIVLFYPRINPNLSLIYKSSNNDIISIDERGKVIPLKKGEAVLQIELPEANISCQKKIYVYEDITIDEMIQRKDVIWGPYERIILNTKKIQFDKDCKLTINSNVQLKGDFPIQTWGEIFIDENSTNIKIDNLYIETRKPTCNGIQLCGLKGNTVWIYQEYGVVIYTKDIVIKNCILNNFKYLAPNGWDHTLDGTQKMIIEQNIFMNSAVISKYPESGFSKQNCLVQHNNFLGKVSPGGVTFIYNTLDYRKCGITGGGDFSNNFWGTTDTNLIYSVLGNKNDDLTIDYEFIYLPILLQPTDLTPQLK